MRSDSFNSGIGFSGTNTDFLRRYARRLLREVHAPQASRALPVLRRLLGQRVLPWQSLSDCYRNRETVQLKHVLRTVAAELGYADWAACKQDVDRHPAELLDRFRVDLGAFGDYHRLWFSTPEEAQRWQAEHGGRVIAYGKQAMVIS